MIDKTTECPNCRNDQWITRERADGIKITRRTKCNAERPMSETTEAREFFSDTRSDDLIVRGEVMWLIERALERWTDSDPPRHALSVLWGEVRDMKDFDTAQREQMDLEQYQSTVSA